jgi:hypothetical protein
MLPSNAADFETVNPPPKRGPRRFGGLIVMIVLLVVLAGVIYLAVTRLPTGTLARPGAPASTAANRPAGPAGPAPTAVVTPVAGTPVDAATQQAVQQVIQQLDDAQADAIATNDPTLMAATATAEFYAEQVASNQNLMAGGVVEVQMVKAEFGQATIDNNGTVTITVYETWMTAFEDGTTEQSRDRNIYTLVQENGTWKVKADVHPDQPSAAGV